MTIFEKDGDYEAFERIREEAVERFRTDLLAWCLMPNHWHLVVKPHENGELSRFIGWFTLTHTQRWHAHYHNIGFQISGPAKLQRNFASDTRK